MKFGRDREGQEGLKYGFIKPSWNPIVGCSHKCSYCWARYLHPRLVGRRYFNRNFEEPELVYKNVGLGKLAKELDRIKRNSWVFVCDMGDLFCKNNIVKKKDIEWVLRTLRRREDLTYLIVTKNPEKYKEFTEQFPKNSYLGTTIGTNKTKTIRKYSRAPSAYSRYKAMKQLRHERKFVGLEPLFDFDVRTLHKWMRLTISYCKATHTMRALTRAQRSGICKLGAELPFQRILQVFNIFETSFQGLS